MRKGHGSTKVPNVKLRPAIPGPSKLKRDRTSHLSEYVDPGEEKDLLELKKRGKRPFTGVVVCASALEDKMEILSQAEELGAQVSSALTDKVTHLLTDKSGSAKYLFCVMNGLPIMKSSWIRDSYKTWLNGDNVEFQDNLSKYALEAFPSIRLCLTGIDPMEKRNDIHKQLERNGGIFIQNLKPDSAITHLLCGAPEGQDVLDPQQWSPKMKFVDKLNKSGKAEVHLVWEEWFFDSLAYGGVLDEEEYLIYNPRPRRKPPKKVIHASSSHISPSRPPLPLSVSSSSLINTGEEEQEIAIVKRVPETTMHLWGGLLKTRGIEVKSGKLVKSPSKLLEVESLPVVLVASSAFPSSAEQYENDSPIDNISTPSISLTAGAFTRSKSFLSSGSTVPRLENTPLASSSKNALAPGSLRQTLQTAGASSFMTPYTGIQHRLADQSTIFLGMTFRPHGEANSQALCGAIESRGGRIAQREDEVVDFSIVRLVSGNQFCGAEISSTEKTKYRTECWVERCLFEERICEPHEHLTFTPLSISTPVEECRRLSIHFSGLDEAQKCWSLRLSRALGITVEDKFTRRTTQLICPSAEGPKFERAQDWSVPVIQVDWLYEIARTGLVPSTTDFLVATSTCRGDSQLNAVTDNIDHTPALHTKELLLTAESITRPATPSQVLKSNRDLEPIPEETCDNHDGDIIPLTVPSPRQTTLSFSMTPNMEVDNPSVPLPPADSVGQSPSSQSTKLSQSIKRVSRDSNMPSREQRLLRIPSSKTPSPLKVPSGPSAKSPSGLNGQSAKALKDTINSLLGKRLSSEEPEGLVHLVKSGKRTRPIRTRSIQDLCLGPALTPAISCEDPSMSMVLQPVTDFDHTLQDKLIDGSMRVTYEDPVQRDEKLKLMSLLGTDDAPLETKTPPKRKLPPRRTGRTARLAGF